MKRRRGAPTPGAAPGFSSGGRVLGAREVSKGRCPAGGSELQKVAWRRYVGGSPARSY